MAARRLLIIMVVLLVLSSLAAALVPPPTERSSTDEGRETTTARSGPGAPAREGELIRARVDADARRAAQISARLGDQLALTVEANAFREVEIPALGLLEPAAPGDPARFDMLVERPGSFLVRLVDGGRAIARIEARGGARVSRSARSGESRGRDRGTRE